MNRCSGCGYILPGAWTECRRCGAAVPAAPVGAPAGRNAVRTALALAPPRPLPAPARSGAAFGAPDDALLPGVHHPRAVVPDTMLPRVDSTIATTPSTHARSTPRTNIVAAIAVVCAIAGAYTLVAHGGH